jgi:hypothetical protein
VPGLLIDRPRPRPREAVPPSMPGVPSIGALGYLATTDLTRPQSRGRGRQAWAGRRYLVAPGIICGGRQLERQTEEGVVLPIEKSVGHEGVNRGHGTSELS